jgi:hypothetical protein
LVSKIQLRVVENDIGHGGVVTTDFLEDREENSPLAAQHEITRVRILETTISITCELRGHFKFTEFISSSC